jgi:hypothetical protein
MGSAKNFLARRPPHGHWRATKLGGTGTPDGCQALSFGVMSEKRLAVFAVSVLCSKKARATKKSRHRARASWFRPDLVTRPGPEAAHVHL